MVKVVMEMMKVVIEVMIFLCDGDDVHGGDVGGHGSDKGSDRGDDFFV